MNMTKATVLSATLAAFALGGAVPSSAGQKTSDADRAFVAKVSQGGMYEVELGKVAEKQGLTQDVKDSGNTESHDHQIVGERLTAAAKEAGIDFSTELNATFKARLAKISALSGEAFDKAYIEDMKAIHAADGAAFLKEAKGGSHPALIAFAAETYNIVQRHVGELSAKTMKFKSGS